MSEFVDLFAGIGGLSCGAEQAGLRPVWASNHWQLACDAYEKNHGIKPVCQCLRQANWTLLPRHRFFCAAPSCQGHARARGVDRPQHDAMRATMWAVAEYLEMNRPEAGVLENVPEVLDWACWSGFVEVLRGLKYSIAPHVLDAADFGVPQNRVRMLGVITRSRKPLWLTLKKQRPVPAARVIDWGAPGWSRIADKCVKTRLRVERGRKVFGSRFLMPYYSSGSGLTGRSLERPIGTISTRDRWAVVDGDVMRFLTVGEIRSFMGFPKYFWLPPSVTAAKHMLGNAVPPPLAREVIMAMKEAA